MSALTTHTLKQQLLQALVQAWNGRSTDTPNVLGQVLVVLMRPISWLFAGAVAIRRELYRREIYKQETMPVPVIVVGNVMVGGVGKTPITMALVNHLKAQGLRVGVLSRGYGRKTTSTLAVSPKSQSLNVGDEPLLIARSCQVPVFVGNSRVDAGLALLSLHRDVQVLVCDDGLQHGPLARDLELCVFDERGLGNGHMLPAGPLREAWPRKALSPNVPCLVLKTGGEAGPNEFAVQRHLADYALQADGTKRSLSSWWDTPVQALAGIAKPEVFFAMLREQGLNVVHTQALPDHADLQALQIDASQGDVLCTEKDAVKLWMHHPKAWAVPLHTTLPDELLATIDLHLAAARNGKLSSPHGHQTA
ncbi:MAG: tetraacyldisaccharide 4'-kinase [Burkholderiales bacterium 35-55-47]|jgi:tetraacyldisaccharide 4'-kinase|uniref:tetraacyldisaccharide 4'-kinase n=1 Tax=Limnohabitans sp. TaxID=1907725 RepID=UPI000BCB8D27|nr:tetraacyldisaccharide 4'-kinase [Limnohabitans sp.]OYY18033.1 MAG: tetraacyldisaccharide 4'-kinase [Burkholderiales bacterium 35-55-47]OYZ73428.1 MAG: tetraacyldisaccharide 4'-kinase [Burkholderiales bacterium 24-55-52]OZB00574.1 MAG: tetraacyldisaccharide 4'-kinase [Burkholderiales bacterium 39-55-53]HQR85683.1 tetraacyldisaccharide 4'-kinase [Limnohabitans sp.]HQS26400.1 tetraacyldisaccharide 4'-kinase [Limnohabitans sp.]